jgi:hypothetical protein
LVTVPFVAYRAAYALSGRTLARAVAAESFERLSSDDSMERSESTCDAVAVVPLVDVVATDGPVIFANAPNPSYANVVCAPRRSVVLVR